MLCQTSRWHQNKGCVLVHGPHTKTELKLWCQREVWHNLNIHPVQIFFLPPLSSPWAESRWATAGRGRFPWREEGTQSEAAHNIVCKGQRGNLSRWVPKTLIMFNKNRATLLRPLGSQEFFEIFWWPWLDFWRWPLNLTLYDTKYGKFELMARLVFLRKLMVGQD